MNNKDIKQLAKSMAKNAITKDVSSYILKRLTKEELKTFLYSFKNEVNKHQVIISTSGTPSATLKKNLEKKYAPRKIHYVINENLGGGIKIQENDIVTDYTFQNIVHQTINALK